MSTYRYVCNIWAVKNYVTLVISSFPSISLRPENNREIHKHAHACTRILKKNLWRQVFPIIIILNHLPEYVWLTYITLSEIQKSKERTNMPPWLRTELFSSTTFYPGKKKKCTKIKHANKQKTLKQQKKRILTLTAKQNKQN